MCNRRRRTAAGRYVHRNRFASSKAAGNRGRRWDDANTDSHPHVVSRAHSRVLQTQISARISISLTTTSPSTLTRYLSDFRLVIVFQPVFDAPSA